MSKGHFKGIAVVGAGSQIGRYLLPRLEAAGYQVSRIGRKASAEPALKVHAFDEQQGCFNPPLPASEALISLAPLPSIPLIMKMACSLGVKRIIAFGSTGRFSKVGSSSPIEQDFVSQQAEAERQFAELSRAHEIAWTLFRPTMIYGAEEDLNVTFISSIIRKFGFFPIAFGAKGLRQPVHADDLAGACVAALECERTFNRAYNLGGGERLSYAEMVRRIFAAERKLPLLLPIPVWLFSLAIERIREKNQYGFIRKEMVERMFVDLIANNAPAEADFGYSPRPFRLKDV